MNLTMVYRCNECHMTHTYDDDARECCAPTITEGFECPTCGDFHEDDDDAIECCADQDASPMPLSAAELESMGKQRLIP